MACGQVGRDAEEVERQVLDRDIAEGSLQQARYFVTGDERYEGQGVIAKWLGVDEGFAKALRQLFDGPTPRNARAKNRAHTGTADEIYRYGCLAQCLHDADVGKTPSSTAGE